MTGIAEFDRVTGGGFVPGSALLVGGDPGIGKSTILIQAAAALARAGRRVVYISGEEAIGQIRLRAERLGLGDAPVELAAETHVEDILATLEAGARSTSSSSIRSRRCGPTSPRARRAPSRRCAPRRRRSSATPRRAAPRSCSSAMSPRTARSPGRAWSSTWSTPCSISRATPASISVCLRAVKNRFGPASEIGVFEMTDAGLEGGRQSLAPLHRRARRNRARAPRYSPASRAPVRCSSRCRRSSPRRRSARRGGRWWAGIPSRLAMILAVLEARCGMRFGGHDVYLNVAGGLRLAEPAADLAVAAALVSSRAGVATPRESVYFGEISLSGAVRPVAQTALRLREAERLGFTSAVLPGRKPGGGALGTLASVEVTTLADIVAAIAAEAAARGAAGELRSSAARPAGRPEEVSGLMPFTLLDGILIFVMLDFRGARHDPRASRARSFRSAPGSPPRRPPISSGSACCPSRSATSTTATSRSASPSPASSSSRC